MNRVKGCVARQGYVLRGGATYRTAALHLVRRLRFVR